MGSSRVSGTHYKDKKLIGKIAFGILIAFCIQFLLYVFLINVLPYGKDINDDGKYTIQSGEVSSFFYEIWDDRQDDGYLNYHENSIQFIHTYNLILLFAVVILLIYYAVILLDEHKGNLKETVKKYFKENRGFMFLVFFAIWSFIGSCFAYDTFRSFIGCHNLRDGWLSFMSYGAILVCMLLATNLNVVNPNKRIRGVQSQVSHTNIDYKKIIVYLFLAVTTFLAIISIGNYISVYDKTPGFFPITINRRGINSFIAQCGIFNNSNHYAYLLSISVIAAATMFVKEKNVNLKIFNVCAYIVMLYMLIINDTFGAYLGVMVAIICMILHAIATIIVCIIKEKNSVLEEDKNIRNSCLADLGYVFGVLAIFIALSCTVTIPNSNGKLFAERNFEYIFKDSIQSIVGTENDASSGNVEVLNDSTDSSTVMDAGDAGSGRWRLWVGAMKIITKNPRNFILGVGSENMLFEYAKIDINEGRSHSLIFQLAGTTGVVGLFLYLAGVICIFFKPIKNFMNWDAYTYTGLCVMVSYLFSSLTGNSAFYTSGYFYIFVGLVMLGSVKKSESENVSKNIKSIK